MVSPRVPALRQAKLVPQDGKTLAVFRRGGEEWARAARAGVVIDANLPRAEQSPDGAPRSGPVPVQGLEFVGKVKTAEKAQFLLVYPYMEEKQVPQAEGKPAKTVRKLGWNELPISLDLAAATTRNIDEY